MQPDIKSGEEAGQGGGVYNKMLSFQFDLKKRKVENNVFVIIIIICKEKFILYYAVSNPILLGHTLFKHNLTGKLMFVYLHMDPFFVNWLGHNCRLWYFFWLRNVAKDFVNFNCWNWYFSRNYHGTILEINQSKVTNFSKERKKTTMISFQNKTRLT